MFFSKKCPKCDSTKIAGPHRIGIMHMFTSDPIMIDLPGWTTPDAPLICFTCAKCGFTEFYADRDGRATTSKSGRYTLNRCLKPRHTPKSVVQFLLHRGCILQVQEDLLKRLTTSPRAFNVPGQLTVTVD